MKQGPSSRRGYGSRRPRRPRRPRGGHGGPAASVVPAVPASPADPLASGSFEDLGRGKEPFKRTKSLSFTDSPLSPEVHSLLIRKFAEFPVNTENTASHRRREMSFELLGRPIPPAADLDDKSLVAEDFMMADREAFGNQETDPEDCCMALSLQDHDKRIARAPHIIRQLFLRGRIQTIVFDCFIHLCDRGACDLSSFACPIDWWWVPKDGSSWSWIKRMIGLFEITSRSWDIVQREWKMHDKVWAMNYRVPIEWLSIMIARSFVDLNAVFNIIRETGLLGLVDNERLKAMIRDDQPSPTWKADPELHRCDECRGNGTYGFWLPETVEPGILELPFWQACDSIVNDFRFEIEKVDRCYAEFFELTLGEMPPPLWSECHQVDARDHLEGEEEVKIGR